MPAAVLALLLFIALYFCPTIADARGNILAVYDVTHASFAWNSSRPTGYGAVPGYRPPPLAHGGNIISASAWRGRWVDVIGSVWLGGRNLVMESGTFNSFDPAWNDLDPSGYSFAGGDPINYFDPDGRFSVSAAKKIWNAGVATLDFLGHGMAAAASAESALYADMAGNAEGAERARGASQYSLNRQEMYVDAVVESYEANRQLQGSHLGAVNATFNPMYGVLVSASEVTEGYGLRPDNLGQRLDYEQKIDSASGGALDFVTAATSAYGITKAPALFRNAAPEAPVRLHGNHLDSTGPHDVYVIRDATTGRVYHFGETGRGFEVRGAEWRRQLEKKHGLQTVVEHLATVEGKRAAKQLETRYINTYEKVYGFKPGFVDNSGEFIQIQKSRH